MKKVKNYLLTIYICLNMLTILLCGYLTVKKYFNMWRLSKLYIVLFILNTIIFLVMLIIKKKKKQIFNFRITDLYLLLIIIFGILSTIFAHDPESALFGFNGRYEGLFSILYYLSIFMLSSFIKKDQKKIVVYVLLFCGVVEAIYAFLQVTQLLPVFTQYNRKKPWATGFITNPNFFGSLMLLCLCYSIGLFLDEKKKIKKLVFIILIFIFMVSLLLSNSLSVIVGLSCVLFYLFIYTIIKKKFKKLCICCVVLLSTIFVISKLNNTTLVYDITKLFRQTVKATQGHVEKDYGSNRAFIWGRTIKEVPYYLPTGVGIDNFYYAFGKRPLMIDRWYFDKAHNEYLQILICEGIFALISYLLFFGTITLRGIKNSFKNNELFLLLPIIGYLVQAFFNISVIEVAPFFYISLGLLVDREERIRKGKRIGIIGHFGGKKEFLDGQTIKTKEVNNYIENYFNIITDKFDTYKNKKNIFGIIPNIVSLLRDNDIIVIVIAIRGYKLLLPIIMFFNKFYKREIYDFVVGGSRYKIFKDNNKITKLSKKINTIYVETKELKKEYNKVGLDNVEVISNFKNINKTTIKKKYNKNKIKVCIFSRIIKEKGIEDGIEAITITNKKIKKDIFNLDIYGVISKDYKKEFNELINNSPDYISYKGKIPYDKSVETLEDYDLMLFLTYYKNEGFAGTLIDAFNSGLPIIATDWHNNFEILKENKTAIKVSIKNPKEVSDKLIEIYNNIDLLKNMRENVLKEADKYDKDKEMKRFISKI